VTVMWLNKALKLAVFRNISKNTHVQLSCNWNCLKHLFILQIWISQRESLIIVN